MKKSLLIAILTLMGLLVFLESQGQSREVKRSPRKNNIVLDLPYGMNIFTSGGTFIFYDENNEDELLGGRVKHLDDEACYMVVDNHGNTYYHICYKNESYYYYNYPSLGWRPVDSPDKELKKFN